MRYLFLSLLFFSLACTSQVDSDTNLGDAGNIKEFTMQAKQFEYVPNEIRVQQWDTVRLKITSQDVSHGFRISEYDIDETLEPNKEVTVEFVASKKGTFTFACTIYCGIGHPGMTGKLIVE